MSDFEKLRQEVLYGLDGRNSGIPMGFEKLNRYVGIRKKIFTLIFGATGSGKSAFVHSSFILNPFDWYMSKENNTKIKLKIVLFSQERSKLFTQMKWISRKIFLDTGTLIPIGKLLGWRGFKKLTSDEHDLFLMYEDYINSMEGIIDIIEGPQNPFGMFKYMREYALAHGKEESVDDYHKIYIPDNENEIVIPIIDHFGLTKIEKGGTKKEAIDKASEYFQELRDKYNQSPVGVSQINRDANNPIYKKMDIFEPNIDQVKESGRPGEDADSVLALFEPHKYKTQDSSYRVEEFINRDTGGDYFRKILVLKNTYGESDVGIGMAFHGATGTFKELPKGKDMEGFDYQSLFEGTYFLNGY